jgi:hypothetical protein
MKWVKGQSGNPAGKPKGTKNKWRRGLDEAIAAVETEKGKKLLHAAVEMAYTDSRMMAAILKKILPDMRHVEADVRAAHEDWIKILEADDPGIASALQPGKGADLAPETGDDLSFLR